jgi:hypothetical protein
MTDEIRLEKYDLRIPPCTLERVSLEVVGDSRTIRVENGEVCFTARGWYEILLTVAWDGTNRDGHRFAHTAIPDSHPLHSEAIEARVLADLSAGRQLLRGNTIFDPNTTISSFALEVWQDSSTPVAISEASICLRRLG